MNPQTIATLAGAVIAVAGALYAVVTRPLMGQMKAEFAAVRAELKAEAASIRLEMGQSESRIRLEMTQMESRLNERISTRLIHH